MEPDMDPSGDVYLHMVWKFQEEFPQTPGLMVKRGEGSCCLRRKGQDCPFDSSNTVECIWSRRGHEED